MPQVRRRGGGGVGSEFLDPRPGAIDLGGELVTVAGVVDHEVGDLEPLLPGYLGGLASPSVVGIHPPIGDDPLDRQLGRTIDNDSGGGPVACLAAFRHERDVEHHHAVGLSQRRHPLADHRADVREGEPLQILPGVRVVEDELGERGTIEGAVVPNDVGAEPVDDPLVGPTARLLNLVDDRVSVDDRRAALGEERRDRRLPAADSSRQPNDQHDAGTVAPVDTLKSISTTSQTRSTGPAAARRATDELAAFAPLVIAVRWATVVVGVGLAAAGEGLNSRTIAGAITLVAYAVLRTVRPLRYLSDQLASFLLIIGEVFLTLAVVVATGYWDSPYVFTLATAIIAAGLARGFGFAIRTAVAAVAAVAIPYHVTSLDADTFQTVQGSGLLVLIALVAGYARHVLGEAERRTTEAMDRVARLSEANELLSRLHRVAQAMPASLDLDETLAGTIAQVRDAAPVDAVAILLRDRSGGGWTRAASWGARFPAALLRDEELPQPVASVASGAGPHLAGDLPATGAPGLVAGAVAGIYAPLAARDELIGVVAAEQRTTATLTPRHLEVVAAICDQAGLAIANARWFRLLRSVGADEERTRIARDLHDRVGQSLTYVAFELDRITRKQESKPLQDDLERLRHDVRRTVTEVRETLHDLHTDVSESTGLVAVLERFLERVQGRTGTEIRFRHDAPARLPLRQEREMWRIAQEAITNAERHSEASHIDVSWQCTGHGALLEVADDGKGISATGPPGEGYGLLGMRERAEAIGATLEIGPSERAGTVVRCRLQPHE